MSNRMFEMTQTSQKFLFKKQKASLNASLNDPVCAEISNGYAKSFFPFVQQTEIVIVCYSVEYIKCFRL